MSSIQSKSDNISVHSEASLPPEAVDALLAELVMLERAGHHRYARLYSLAPGVRFRVIPKP